MIWSKPLNKKFYGATYDLMSFKNIDISIECQIPIGNHVGSFGVERRFEIHKGVDLYANEGDEVFAVESGVISDIRPFTGEAAGCPWCLDTDAINVEGRSGVVVYGEIAPSANLSVGSVIRAGDLIGTVKRVLRNDKGRPTSMLHMALHRSGVQVNGVWEIGKDKPAGLLDPTGMLLNLSRHDG